MKKHMLIAVSSFVLATGLNASQRTGGEHCFRPAFQKKLKHVKPVGLRSFNARSKNLNKKAVFIDWRKLYWGNLSDLIYSEEEAYIDDVQKIAGKELRRELKAFAKQYGLKIMWRKKPLGITDATAAFLEYWDKGFSRKGPGKVLSFAELCALSVRNTSVSDTSIKETSAKGESSQNQIKDASFPNPFLEKEA